MDIKITSGELNNWKHDGGCYEIPTTYLLGFKFHDEDFMAYFTTANLKAAQDGEPLDSSCAETYSDLLYSFMVKLEDEDVTKEVLSYCKKIWKECLTNVGVYNYLGEKL